MKASIGINKSKFLTKRQLRVPHKVIRKYPFLCVRLNNLYLYDAYMMTNRGHPTLV